MLLSIVPAAGSILPPGPNGNLAPQPGQQSQAWQTTGFGAFLARCASRVDGTMTIMLDALVADFS